MQEESGEVFGRGEQVYDDTYPVPTACIICLTFDSCQRYALNESLL